MGYMIEISTEKKEELAENIEQALHYAGKAMACVEQMAEGKMGQRMGNRRMGYRDEMDDTDPYMGERRYGRRIGMRDPYYY